MQRRDVLRTIALGGVGTAVLGPAVAKAAPPTPLTPLTPDLNEARSSPVWACWIGHATVLLKLGDAWVLTDPVMMDAYGVNVLGFTLGPRRLTAPPISVDELPKPDLVLLSHAHLDHMDRPTLEALSERFPREIDVITAHNTQDVIEDLPWRSLNEMDWGDEISLHGFDLQCLEVKHNGWRWPGEACRAGGQRRTGRSFNGYYLTHEGTGIVFGGDTAYTDAFSKISGPVDLAIMPIGAYGTCPDVHCNPEEALEMSRQMRARSIMPIHHSTFNQAEEPLNEPLQRLHAAIDRIPSPDLALEQTGGTIRIV